MKHWLSKHWLKISGIVAAAALGVMVFGTAAFAQGPGGDPGAPGPQTPPWMHQGPGRPGFRGHPRPPRFLMEKGLEALAEVLNMDVDELKDALKEGQTPQELAEAQGLDWEEVQAQLHEQALEAARERLAQAVEEGKLTQEQADAILERMENAPLGAFRKGFRQHRGAPGRGCGPFPGFRGHQGPGGPGGFGPGGPGGFGPGGPSGFGPGPEAPPAPAQP